MILRVKEKQTFLLVKDFQSSNYILNKFLFFSENIYGFTSTKFLILIRSWRRIWTSFNIKIFLRLINLFNFIIRFIISIGTNKIKKSKFNIFINLNIINLSLHRIFIKIISRLFAFPTSNIGSFWNFFFENLFWEEFFG